MLNAGEEIFLGHTPTLVSFKIYPGVTLPNHVMQSQTGVTPPLPLPPPDINIYIKKKIEHVGGLQSGYFWSLTSNQGRL